MTEFKSIPQYEVYKDSGVKFIGTIPDDWIVKKAKFIASIFNGDSLNEKAKQKYASYNLEDRAYISSKDICADFGKINYENGLSIPKTESSYKIAPQESSLLCIEGGSAGKKIAFTLFGVCFVNKLACIKANLGYMPRYVHYLLRSEPFQNQFKSSMTGMIGGVGISNINNFYLTSPPIDTQQRIADFLEKNIIKIDHAIAIKEKQITLLKERKQIIIKNAVTRGIDPNAAMRDSGVEWIGVIPEHWEVRRSKFLFMQRKERAWKDDVQLSATQAYGVIPQEKYEELTGKRVVKIQFHLDKRKHVEKDDFVISMRSFQGGLERAWARGCIRSSYVVLKPLQKIYPGFYGYLLKLPSYIKALQQTASFIRDGQDLNFDNFSQVDLFIPPIKEQREISKYIESFMVSSDDGLMLLKRQIEKLKEYKTTLINSAVTGKIKVPGVDEQKVA